MGESCQDMRAGHLPGKKRRDKRGAHGGVGVMRENKAAVWAGQTAGSKALPFQAQALSELQAGRWTWGQLAPRAVYVQSGRRYANRTMRPLPQLCPQGAHIPVLTARFPLQGALQTLPVTGREPDTQRSPQTTPPRELLTPARGEQG